MRRAPQTIKTERLVLSRPRSGDAQAMFDRYASDADVTRYLGWPRHRSVADTAAYIALAENEWVAGPAGAYLVRARDDGRLLGATGLSRTGPGEFLTGYVLAKDAWGVGYATEALRAVVNLARTLSARRVYALCHPEHRASRRVLEKCGFVVDHAWTRPIVFPNLGSPGPHEVVCYAHDLRVTH